MNLANRIDDDVESFWVNNHNIWLVDALGGLLALLIGYIIFSWIFGEWRKIQRLKNEKARAELALLKNQINPHFFFNTLNNLYSLIKRDPDTAQEYVLKLSDMMRFTITGGLEETVSLQEEVKYLNDFLDLQISRYHKDIDIRFDISISDYNYRIPPLLLIILLENAFKHGVEKMVEGPFVHIRLVEHEELISFAIKNNYDADVFGVSTGIGLVNLQSRLDLLYPDDRHSLDLKRENEIFSAHLEIYKW